MYKPKLYVHNWNGILTNLKKMTKDFRFVEDINKYDAIVAWQDEKGPHRELALFNRKFYKKPFIVVQHGRGCTRNYGPPENQELLADKFCCWGQEDYDRMVKYGYKDRIVITGCPLLNRAIPKEPHEGKNILFVPVITDHEDPNNIITLWELKKLELSHAQDVVRKHKSDLMKSWDRGLITPGAKDPKEDYWLYTIPYNDINKNWRLISKIIGIHDKDLYFSPHVQTRPGEENHTEECVKLLAKTDVVVCVEEGTFQVLAMAMDIPIIVVKGFELLLYGGVDYSKGDRIAVHTEATEWVELSDLDNAIQRELDNPGRLSKERKEVIKREFGDISSNPDDNIANVIKELVYDG